MTTTIVIQPEADGLPPTRVLLERSRQARAELAAATDRARNVRTTGGDR